MNDHFTTRIELDISNCNRKSLFDFSVSGTMEKKEKVPGESKDVGLKQNIGLLSAVNIIIGVMIGSGIFISPTAALNYSGSVGMCLVIWALCGIVSLLGKLIDN